MEAYLLLFRLKETGSALNVEPWRLGSAEAYDLSYRKSQILKQFQEILPHSARQ